MNFKQSLLTATAAATALFGMVSAPAQAFNLGESFTLDKDAVFDFEFIESHGYFQSIVGLMDGNGNKIDVFGEATRSDGNSSANDWQGTCGVTVTNCTKSVTLTAGTYSFFLDRISNANRISIDGYGAKFFNEADTADVLDDRIRPDRPTSTQKWRNPNTSPSSQLALTPSSASTNPFAEKIFVGFEDFGLPGDVPHIDYNDMMIKVKATQLASVPEPATLAGLGLVGGALAFSRNRQRKANRVS